jgi:hypothetical protein
MGTANVEFINAPADYTSLTDYPLVFDDGKSNSGSVATGSTSGGGTPVGTTWTPIFEELIGTKDGVNDTFTTSRPRRTGFPFRIVNQIQQQEGAGKSFTYSVVSGVGTIVFSSGAIPQTGDYVTADYYY